jgi:opacity protein-like surface antigen
MNLYKCILIAFVMISSSMTIGVSSSSADQAAVYNLQMKMNLPLDYAGPQEEWNKTYGGVAAEEGWMVQHTKDGGFILIGYTASFGSGSLDIWLIKTDAEGNQQWSKTFGGSGGDFSRAVQQTSDGGYIIGATTQSFGSGGDDIWVIKTDASGNIVWQKTFGGRNQDHCNAILQLPSGDYVLIGDWDLGGTSDLCVMKLDSAGNQLWMKVYSNEHFGFGHSIQMTSDGGFILLGGIDLYGDSDMWLMKTDANGTMIWEKTFGERTPEIGTTVIQTLDDSFLLGGWILPADFNKSILLIKTDSEGNSVWEKKINAGHAKEQYTNTLGVDETTDGGYIVAGEKIESNDKDAWLLKTDVNGNMLWDMTIGGVSDEYSCGVEQIDDEHVIVVGSTKSYDVGGYDMWLIKVSQGNGTFPPLKPTINGPISGKVNNEYPYTSSTTDPEGNQVFYWFDWADGTNSGWLGPYNSGEECSAFHTWTLKGNYEIKVKAKDIYGAESSWSEPLPITMPYSYHLKNQFLELLFQHFPHAFPKLRQLVEY